MRRLIPAVALLAIHLCAGAAIAQGRPDPRADSVDALFQRYNRVPGPGLAVAVVRDARVVLRRGFGLADVENAVPITPATVFDIASLSKQMTGLAVAMLVAEGKVKLTDDIRKYIPEMPDLGRTITVGHLLHHTSGLRDWPGTLVVGGTTFADPISFDHILKMAYNQQSLNFQPGDEHVYSNTGYNVLADLVQRVTGEPFREWTTRNLFAPLGMAATVVRDDPRMPLPDHAIGYARQGGSWHRTPNHLSAPGSSSIFSTADDLARWMINLDRAEVGGRTALGVMWKTGRLNDGSEVSYGGGLGHGRLQGRLPFLAHSGGWASFATYLVYFPEQRTGVVVLANSGSIDAEDAAFDVARIYLGKELQEAPAPPAEPGPACAPIDSRAATLDRYTGLYRLGPGWLVRIRRQGSALTAQATHEGEFPMSPRCRARFWVDAYRSAITFHPAGVRTPAWLEYRGIHAPKLAETTPPTLAELAAFAGEYESAELGTAYRVIATGAGLSIQHPRHGTVPLTWVWGNEFGSSSTWFLRSVTFQRARAGRPTALLITPDNRSRNIRFVRK